ncbi:MAG TPA: hypothetical protein VGD95_08160 [Micavibrio sp.]
MSYKSTYNRWAAGASGLLLAGCASVSPPNPDTCMQESSVNALLVGFGGTKYNTSCNDGRMAFALMNRADDPVGNALGFLLYLDQNPEAKKMLENRMGGKDKVKMSGSTVAGFLLSNDDTSRSIGAQIYMGSDEPTRAAVNEVLIRHQIDPRQHIPASLRQDVQNATFQWAQAHAAAPQGVRAQSTLSAGKYLKKETKEGVNFIFKKAKP